MAAVSCRCHCRGCNGHFTSLRAFDPHRSGPMSDRRCELPDDLVELERGVCRIAGPEHPAAGVTLYGVESNAKEHFRPRGRQAARVHGSRRVVAQ
jgi:hypothetical protein